MPVINSSPFKKEIADSKLRSSTLKRKAAGSSDTLVFKFQTTHRHISEDLDLQNYGRVKLKPHGKATRKTPA
jgi:hypothetical protein